MRRPETKKNPKHHDNYPWRCGFHRSSRFGRFRLHGPINHKKKSRSTERREEFKAQTEIALRLDANCFRAHAEKKHQANDDHYRANRHPLNQDIAKWTGKRRVEKSLTIFSLISLSLLTSASAGFGRSCNRQIGRAS